MWSNKFKNNENGISRESVKDDYKIVSQCNFNNISYLITEDQKLFNLLLSLKGDNNINFKPLLLQNGHVKSFELQIGLFS